MTYLNKLFWYRDEYSYLKTIMFYVAWGLTIIIGFILLIAGFLKAYEPLEFIKQIESYKIFHFNLLHTAIAWIVIVLEITLGTALIIGYRLKHALWLTIILFTVFIGVISWGWINGTTTDCGCFGSKIKRTPQQALLEDSLLLIACCISLGVMRKQIRNIFKNKWRSYVIYTFACISLLMPLFFGLFSNSNQEAIAKIESGIQDVKITGLSVNLKQGEYIVALISADCEHCQGSVPTFNEYLSTKGIPTLIVLSTDPEWKRKFFTERYKAKFSIGEISQADFDKIIGIKDTPYIIYLRNGKAIKTWDGMAPMSKELVKVTAIN